MRHIFAGLLIGLATATPAATEGDMAGDFDYFVLALSWSATWCTLEGDARGAPQCTTPTDHGWTLHGLWPQFHEGYPSHCDTAERPPSRAMTQEMTDIMGTAGLAWHQWKKHGTCTGRSAADYYAMSRDAYARIARPDVFRKLQQSVKLPASVVEEAFLKANPDLEPAGITITCKQGHIQEARICMSRDLDPIACGRDVRRDCTLEDAVFTPMRR